jgi:hypothetical protein
MLNLNAFKYIYILNFKNITNKKIKYMYYYKKKFLFNANKKKKINYRVNFEINLEYNNIIQVKNIRQYKFKKYIKNFNFKYDVLSFNIFNNQILKFKDYYQNEFFFFYKTNKTFYKNRQIYKPY